MLPNWTHRRSFALVLTLVAVALGLHHLGKTAVDLQIHYHFGTLADQLTHCRIRYMNGELLARQIHFDYRIHPAQQIQVHQTQLTRGEYRVLLRLTLKQAALEAPNRRLGPRRTEISIDRKIVVDDAGILSVYVSSE